MLIFISQMVGGIKATLSVLIEKRTEMSRSTSIFSTTTERMQWTLAHIIIVLTEWGGEAKIFDKSWNEKGANMTLYCDIALGPAPKQGSFGKGTYMLPSGNYAFSEFEDIDLYEAKRTLKHSTTHLELSNMLFSILYFASKEQKILCVCDNKAAVGIAKARYSAKANPAMEQLLHRFDIECLRRDLSIRFKWQSRHDRLPKIADHLSRGEVSKPLSPLPP